MISENELHTGYLTPSGSPDKMTKMKNRLILIVLKKHVIVILGTDLADLKTFFC